MKIRAKIKRKHENQRSLVDTAQIFAKMSAKLRLRAISTQPRVTARLSGAGDQPLPNSTRRYRRWVEKQSEPQFVAHRNRRAARQALRRHEQQAALELLKQSNV